MEDNSSHNILTPHGLATPHGYPTVEDVNIDILNKLSVQLYPTGRAWYLPQDGVFYNVHTALNQSFAKLIREGDLFLDGLFPDNVNFTIQDAALWEYRLGLITNNALDLELRKEAIRRKLGHPNNVKARQHPLFIQNQLQLAGFNVWVHENEIPYQTPSEITTILLDDVFHGAPTQHGNSTQHGLSNHDVIANSIDEVEFYSTGGEINLWSTFFIGGEILGSIATVPFIRLREFKELVIKLKPAHTVAFTFINYN